MSDRVIAVIDWRAAAPLKDNARLLERAGGAGNRSARGRRCGAGHHRSLTLMEDGTCVLERFSPAAVARRIGGVVGGRAVRKAKGDRRG